MKDINSDLQHYADQWEKALKDGIFADAPKPKEAENPTGFGSGEDFFGLYPDTDEDAPLNECDTQYWNMVYRMSNHQGESPDILKEDKTKGTATAPNPIQSDSVGIDQETTDDFYDVRNLTELSELKSSLEKLESKLNSEEGLGKKSGVQSKIDTLKKQINDLSDSLTSH